MRDPSFSSLTTERLIVRRLRAEDAATLACYRSDPAVARYQGWESCSIEDARRLVEEMASASPGAPGPWFQFAVADRDTDTVVGDCALRCIGDEPCQAELGFTFAREHQGRGYAVEAVGGLLDYVFTTLQAHRVFALTDLRNEQAGRLLERLGFRREGQLVEGAWYKGEWTDELIYARLRREWQADRGCGRH